MSLVTRKLIAKELHVNRWFLAGGAAVAAVSAFVASFGKGSFNIGGLTWLTTVIALGVMLAIYGVMHERKERSLEFVLSLPISVREYVRAKMTGLLLCFVLPWLAATLAAVTLVLADPDVADGLLPYVVLLCGFLLTNFALVMCGALHVHSESAIAAVIIVTNMFVSVFMFTVGAMPGIKEFMDGAVPVWNTTFWKVLTVELVVFFISITLPLVFAARRRDFI